MELYLLKSGACLVIFFLFYKLLLENTSYHLIKRVYLLAVILASFLIPLITFTTYTELLERTTPILMTPNSEGVHTDTISIVVLLKRLFWIVYGLGVLFFSVRFLKNIRAIHFKIRRNPKHKIDRIVNVLLKEKVTPHTFFNYIFLNKARFEAQEIPTEVLWHEQTHARQKHSLDILFMELLQIVFWFNPLVYWMKHAVKLNHEFLADQAVLKKGITPDNYQNLILTFSSNVQENYLANAIHYSFIKKRFTLMKTITSKKAIRGRLFLLLPLLALVLFSFSQRETLPLTNEEIAIQESATREEMKEYTLLAKKYNAQDKEERVVLLKDLKRLEYIYKKMSAKQKATAEPFPECIPPPPPPRAPDAPKTHAGEAGIETPPAVPTAPSPPPVPLPSVDPAGQLIELAKKGATFYLEGKKIDAEKAIEIMRKSNSFYRVEVQKSDSNNPIVKLTGC